MAAMAWTSPRKSNSSKRRKAAMTKNKKTLNRTLVPFKEPRLRFGYEQTLEDPKDGLMLFGPPETVAGLQYGMIGTPESLRQFESWIAKIRRGIPANEKVTSSVMFPGFEAVFRASLPAKARAQLPIDP